MTTDIDKLHEVIERRERGEYLPRQYGKTTARIHELMGMVGVWSQESRLYNHHIQRYVLPKVDDS
jgi:hypothetical protein